MKPRLAVRLPVLLALVPALLPAQEVTRTFALRFEGKTVGSTTEVESATTEDGRAVIEFTSKTVAKIELLGASFDQHIEQTWILDATSRAVLRVESSIRTGDREVKTVGRLVDGRFRLDGGDETYDPATVVIAPDYHWLAERGPKRPGESLVLPMLIPEMSAVKDVGLALADAPEGEFVLDGVKTRTLTYRFDVAELGIESTVTVTAAGELVRYTIPSQAIVLERIDPAELGTVQRVDFTDRILVATNLDIPDPSPLTYVKLRATIETAKAVTAESLDVPGQTFTGTVVDGRVEGVFEIRSRRPDAAGSPPFPAPAETFAAEWLQPFLAPTKAVIESDDAGIAAKAKALADGSATCFEVVERLARWVHDNIPYVIPGGGSAKGTFDTRQGECGGHSRLLAAMLRSQGIPARTPMGGMYVPIHGGSFGQHMWTEVWLGDAIGWLPVDCTAGQSTYVDASHIRLADGDTVFRAKAIEVLEYEPKVAAVAPTPGVVRRTDAWPMTAGTPLLYLWSMKGKDLGDERVSYAVDADGRHVFEGSVSLANGAYQETTRTVVGDDGRMLAFHAERTQGPQQVTFDIAVEDGKAVCVRRVMDEERRDEVEVDPAALPLHNNCMVHVLLAANRWFPLPDGAAVELPMFHTEQRSILKMTLRGAGTEKITIGGEEVVAHVVQASLVGINMTLHLDDRGRMLRFQQAQGEVSVELQR